jgi:hypothetical protein
MPAEDIDLLTSLSFSAATIKFGGKALDLHVTAEDTVLNPEELSEALIELPGEIGFWSSVYSTALSQVDLYKNMVEEVKAKIEIVIRDSRKEEKITEALIKALVTAEDEVINVQDTLIKYKWIANMVKSKLSALELKHKSALDLSASRRREVASFLN